MENHSSHLRSSRWTHTDDVGVGLPFNQVVLVRMRLENRLRHLRCPCEQISYLLDGWFDLLAMVAKVPKVS
jgi:hypothetical protein